MRETDARRLNDANLEVLRRHVVHMVVVGGQSRRKTAELLGLSRDAVNDWCSAYKKLGPAGLVPKKRGTKGRPLLNPEQQARIKALITEHLPDHFKLPFTLWTRDAVRRLIKKVTRVEIQERAVGDYLQKWGFSPSAARQRGSRTGSGGGAGVLRTDTAGGAAGGEGGGRDGAATG